MPPLDLGALRQPGLPSTPDPEPADVDLAETIVADPSKPSVEIELPDGSVSISFGKPQAPSQANAGFDANLAETLDENILGTLANELVDGIEADEESRREWIQERAEGIKLLALKIEKPTSSSSGMGAGVDNTSRSRSTLLLEAVLRFQANASAELLPSDGPVKIQSKMSSDTIEGDETAQLLEDDMNYYLTEVASEYYPDTERMLFWTGMGGSGFKKLYRCPIRQRPVSESVDAADLIVSNTATDLRNAERVTFKTVMSQSTLKRMQKIGAYRTVDLGQPVYPVKNAIDEEKESITGVTTSQRPEDAPFIPHECYCLIEVPGDERKDGLPRPYKVTLDKETRTILEIRRDWRKEDELERRRETFVKFPYVPGIGFYEIGLVHIASNPTTAATALLRVMIDSGIFANFPGGLIAKSAAKQNTMDISVPPGGFAPIDTSGVQTGDIRAAVMALPYKEPGASIMKMFEDITQAGQRISGTAEIMVGEGQQDAPVGTTIALIEQAVKVLNGVHKRLHKAQSKELQLLRDLFKEYPEDFVKFNQDRDSNWDKDKLLKALSDYNLVPKADPNTASHIQRIMRAQAVYQMAKADPELFQIGEVIDYVLKVIGINNPASLTQAPQSQSQQPDPKAQAAMIGAQADLLNAQSKAKDVSIRAQNLDVENTNRDKDRAADLQIASEKLRTEEVIHGQQASTDMASQSRDHAHERGMQAADLASAASQQPLKPA